MDAKIINQKNNINLASTILMIIARLKVAK